MALPMAVYALNNKLDCLTFNSCGFNAYNIARALCDKHNNEWVTFKIHKKYIQDLITVQFFTTTKKINSDNGYIYIRQWKTANYYCFTCIGYTQTVSSIVYSMFSFTSNLIYTGTEIVTVGATSIIGSGLGTLKSKLVDNSNTITINDTIIPYLYNGVSENIKSARTVYNAMGAKI